MESLNINSDRNSDDKHGRATAVWSAIAAVLMAAVLTGACGWWLNSKLNTQGTSLTRVLGMHQGMQQTVDSLSRRMIGAESALSGLPAELKKVNGRVDALDQKVTAVRQAVAKPQPIPPPVNTAAIAEMGKQLALLSERLMTLEAKHNEDIARLETLRSELAVLSQDTERYITAVRAEIPPDNSAEAARLWSAMDDHQESILSMAHSIDGLAGRIDRDRHDFEIHENRASEVAPGIHLTIRSTNVGRQQISGWVYMENEHRVVFLKNHGLLEPITVYGVHDQQAREIVITRVRENDAIGYVLSPKSSSQSPEPVGLAASADGF